MESRSREHACEVVTGGELHRGGDGGGGKLNGDGGEEGKGAAHPPATDSEDAEIVDRVEVP